MDFLNQFIQNLQGLVKLIEQGRVNPEHIRIWLQTIGLDAEVTPDPSDPAALEKLQEVIDDHFCEFLARILRDHLRIDVNEDLTQEQIASLHDLGEVIEHFIRAGSARQKRGEDGWVYTTVSFMGAAAEGLITTTTLEVLLRSLNTDTRAPIYDA